MKCSFYNSCFQTPLTMEDGEVTSIMGIVRDVTSRQASGERNKKKEEQI